MVAFPSDIIKKILPEPINNTYNNTTPVLTPDESQIFYMTEFKFYDAVMHSSKTFEKLWDVPENMTPIIKSDGDYYILDISSDGNTLLFYFYEPYLQGELYTSKKEGDSWGPLTKLNENINTQFHESSGSFSPDGKTLYFTSNREGSIGGTDIYYSQLDSTGDWGPAYNLGDNINTTFDEETPFVSPDGSKLFFSSKGHYNIGGFDIFYSLRDSQYLWTPPINLGYPLNTTDNDIFYYPMGDGFTGYSSRYSDNRSGISDIYKYQIMAVSNPPKFKVFGQIQYDSAQVVDKVAQIAIRDPQKDTLKQIISDADGTFEFKVPAGNYNIGFSHEELPTCEIPLDIPLYSPDKEIQLYPALIAIVENIPSETLPDTTPVSITSLHLDTIVLFNILFPFDAYQINQQDKDNLTVMAKILISYPDAIILFTGFTDAIGNEKYNQYLSEKRARNVATFFNQLGIPSKNIEIKGLGETNPVAPNVNPDGSDNPEGRKLNRRVEIDIQENYKELILR